VHCILCICDRNGIKVLLGTGAVYLTVNEGVWSTSESGLNAAQRLRTYVLPETTQYWDKVIVFFSVQYYTYLQQYISRNCEMALCVTAFFMDFM